MSGRRIAMNDGTIYEDSEIGYSNDTIWCFISNHTIVEVFSDFSDRSKIARLTFQYGEMEDTYENYTELGAFIQNGSQVQIQLKQPNIS